MEVPPPLPPGALHGNPAARFRGTWKRAGSRTPCRGTIKLVVLLEVEVEVDATMGNRAQIWVLICEKWSRPFLGFSSLRFLIHNDSDQMRIL
jgi:hypothetical protein